MTLQQWWQDARKQLKGIYEEREASNILQWLLEDSLKLNRTTYQLRLPKPLTENEQVLLNHQLSRLAQGEPLQYITEIADFYSHKFRVGPEVLIPRPETEELVSYILKTLPKELLLTLLDVGTGSGCIPISLKLEQPRWKVHAIDVSREALAVAKWNSSELGAHIYFTQSDFLNEEDWANLVHPDVLISNPPYIAKHEAEEMTANVLRYEPTLALFPEGDDVLIFYKKLATFAARFKPKHVFLELNPNYAYETAHLFQTEGYNVALVQDMQGKDRMLHAQLI